MQFLKLPSSDEETANLRGELLSYDSYTLRSLSRLINGKNLDADKLYPDKDLRWWLEGPGGRRSELWPFAYSCLECSETVYGVTERMEESA